MKKGTLLCLLFMVPSFSSTYESNVPQPSPGTQNQRELLEATEIAQKLIEKDTKTYQAFLKENAYPKLDSLTILTCLFP